MGESTGGGGNESDNQQDDGGRRPGDPQVFGVDGVSKTGSTSKDQQIGFTDGQGGKGANFDALQGATRQQTTAAVAAADAARNAGGGDTAAQQAVRGILDSYDPSAVNRQGNLTDSGRNLVNEAAQDALEFERITQDQQRAQAASDLIGGLTTNLGAGVAPQVAPSNFDSQLVDFLDAQAAEDFRAAEVAGVRAPPNIGFDITQPGITPAEAARFDAMGQATREELAKRAGLRDLSTFQLENQLVRSTRDDTLEPGALVAELQDRALSGDTMAQEIFAKEAELAGTGDEVMTPFELAAYNRARNAATLPQQISGITTLPEAATAGAVLQGNQPPRGTISITRQAGPGDDTSSQQLLETLDPATQALINRAGTTAPDPLLTTGTAPGVEDSVVGGPIAATGGPMQRVDPTQVGGISVPTPPPDRFKTNAQRDFFENLASLPGGQAQFDAELANLANRGFTGRRIASVISEGGVPNYDPSAPEGFRIRGATGTNFVDLPFLGTTPISTYTGLDNPNAPADTSSDEPVTAKAPNDPCPAGYQLINGVCQPVDDVTQAPPPSGSDFQINPTTGLPTVFQPTTVATPVGPINPFVLQPFPRPVIGEPVPFAGGAQGIQALSPTGAALGRQV